MIFPPIFTITCVFLSICRNCIGQEFAMNEEKVVLAHILRNFELSLDETKSPVKMDYLLIVRPKNGLHLKLKPRKL